MEESSEIKKEFIDHETDFCFVPPALDIAEALEEAIDSLASGAANSVDPLADTAPETETPSDVVNEAEQAVVLGETSKTEPAEVVVNKTEDCEPSAPVNVWENIKCILCQTVLTPALEPKLLECLHSACNSCIQNKLNPAISDTTELGMYNWVKEVFTALFKS